MKLFVLLIFFVSCNSSVDVSLNEGEIQTKENTNEIPAETESLEVGDVMFAKSIGGNLGDSVKSIIETSSGSLYFCGVTRDNYSIDGIGVDANTTQDEFVVGKLNLNNEKIEWIKTAGKKEARSFCANIAIDTSENVYTIGTYYTNLNLGSGDLGSNGDRDFVIAKYTSSGNLNWVNSYGGTAGEEVNGLTVLGNGDVVASGFFRNTVDFGLGNETSAGDSDAFLMIVNSAGSTQYGARFGLTGKDYYWDVAHDSSNNIYASGEMIGNIDLGGGALTQIGGRDIFLGKYDNLGNHIWSMNFGVVGDEYTRDIAVNSSGETVIAGHTKGDFNIGGAGHTNQGGTDLFLAKVDASGSLSWARAFGTINNENSYDVIFDEDENIIMLASFSGTINVGGNDLTSYGGVDILIAKFDSSGNHIFSKNFGGTLDDSAEAMVLGSDGNIFISGSFNGQINLSESISLTSNGSSDGHIIKIKN